MVQAGGSVEAILTLNAVPFKEGLDSSISAVKNFTKSLDVISKDSTRVSEAIGMLESSLTSAVEIIGNFNASIGNLKNFSSFAQAVNRIANALKILSSSEIDIIQSTEAVNNMFRAFKDSLNGAEIRVKGLGSSFKQLSASESQEVSNQQRIQQALANSRNSISSTRAELMNLARALNSEDASILRVTNAMTQYSYGATNVMRSTQQVSEVLRINSQEMLKNAEAKLRAMGYNGQLSSSEQRLANAEQQVSNSANREASSIQRANASMNQGVGSANRLTGATNKLKGAMSSLRMMASMVGSMIAYNFAHKLLVATGETIHAKSEMEGYFKMLNFGQSEIDGFNKALDNTVAQFQRVNKYSLGETISSIGVEFNLTTQEMEKAMKVTSMITSEYLRAGRNANEASLAVKDVLQGQFQRLSRETGVKGEQLKEAGWSGDTTDVLGLMKALEKVGHDRNWDVFAEKANSLNDVITILQNRFGEWSADMVYKVQPAILSVFNSLMSVGSMFGEVFNGLLDWLTGDAFGQGVGWTLLATHIASVVLGLVHLRTGANLTQIAQMGLTRSIGATVLGLEAETVAEHGLRTSLVASVTGIEAETVANEGRLTSIIATISGLEAEEVANIGRGKTLLASILGLDMATLKEYGFATALGVATTQMEAQTFASKGLLTQIALIGATTLPAIAVVGSFAVAFGSLAMKTMEATNRMKDFYDIQKNGKQYVNDARDSVKMLEDKQKDLTETQKKYTQGSAEYENVGKAINNINDKLEIAKRNVDANYEAWQKVVSAQGNYDSTKQEAQLDLQQKINQSLVDTGLSTEQADEISNNYLRNAIEGSEQLYNALQSVVNQYSKTADGVKGLTDYWSNMGLSEDEIALKVKPYVDAQEELAGHIEKMKLSTDLIEVAGTWLMVQYDQIKLTFAENLPKIESGDWAGGLSGMLLGLAHGLADLPVFSDFWDYIWDHTIPDLKGKGWDGLKQALWRGFEGLFKWSEGDNLFGHTLWGDLSWVWDTLTKDLTSSLTNFDLIGKIFDLIFPKGVSASDGSSDHPSFMEDLSSILGFDIQAWIDSFMADPLGTLGIDLGGFDILGTLTNFLFGTGDVLDFSWATEWLNNNVITPLSETWNNFMADPLGTIGGLISATGIGGLLNMLLPSDGGVGIWEWANTNIIQPFGQALWSGITSIPLLGDILQLLATITGANPDAQDKGSQLARAFGNAVENFVGNIPILGDVLRFLGVIPQANPTASSNGQGVGKSIKDGVKNGVNGLADLIKEEMGNVISAIKQTAQNAYDTAHDVGSQILNGIRNALDMHSPSIISRELISNEFGTYIPEAITSNGDLAYQSAQYYGQQITDGISSVNTDSLNLDTAIGNYETDAQMIATSSQMMGMTTSTAFNDMSLAVNNTTSTMATNVGSTYSQMQTKQQSSLQSMKTQNQTAYHEMYLKSNQSLIQMRDSTTNITHQMINAWSHMKTQLVATANQLRSESTSHFNRLSETIGSFYRKIQNPSNWGAGTGSSTPVRSRRNTTAGRSFARGMRTRTSLHGAGSSSTYTGSTYMTISSLKKKLCPDGSCSYLFDGFNPSDRVNVEEFLASITGEHGFGWSGWDKTHFNYIKNTSDKWDMKSPVIQVVGGVPTNAQFKVGDFENGTPSISFDSFKSMAESIFTAIPYRHYMDSSWKGSWLGAIQSGACNCSDGAEAIIAFASACGFGGGQKVHGYWGNEGHFWAVINGEVFDTTAMQKGYGWRSPSVHGYGTKVRTTVSSGEAPSNGNKTFNITVNINEPVYGVDDLDAKIQDSIDKGLQREFNDPYSVAL